MKWIWIIYIQLFFLLIVFTLPSGTRRKDVLICDWHYAPPGQTAVYFTMKGFDVVTCSWRNPDVAVIQVDDMLKFRNYSTQKMKAHFKGRMHNLWSGARSFLDEFYSGKVPEKPNESQVQCFKAMFKEMAYLINRK